MRNLVLAYILISGINSCKTVNTEGEDALRVSKLYCNCLETQIKQLKDSLLDENLCERKIFSGSRLLSIYSDFDNWNKYKKETLDSAKEFAVKVRNITDTLCYNKIDFTNIKRRRRL